MVNLVHELIFRSADQKDGADALIYQNQRIDYPGLASEIQTTGRALLTRGLDRGERAAVYLEKNLETVIALFGISASGGVFVPINPLLKSEQVAHILCDCNARVLVTSFNRLQLLVAVLPQCHDLHTVVVIGGHTEERPVIPGLIIIYWEELNKTTEFVKSHPVIDTDMAAILYTSGSVGKPKGVVLSHRNLVAGAKSVCQYLGNTPKDRILSVLPLSFDYGFSQLTTAFFVGATSVLMNYLLPRDIVSAVEEKSITGLAAVPHLWIQLAQCDWNRPRSLRYITSSGGVMPRTTLDRLRKALPRTKVFLMYGLTEAFRSTFLPPEDIEDRPDSIGKAIPNAEVFVLREDGTQCAPGEPGELVHRGSLVAMGYWNDPQRTAACFKPLPLRHTGLTIPELAVWSGDTVRMDEAGYLYFIGRRDEMIKTAGYRISPTEVEEIIYATECVEEAAAVGVPHPTLGQTIVVVVTPRGGVKPDTDALLAACKRHLPNYMHPGFIDIRKESLPRNANGKIDRLTLARELQFTFVGINQ